MSPRCLTVFEQSCKSKRTLRDYKLNLDYFLKFYHKDYDSLLLLPQIELAGNTGLTTKGFGMEIAFFGLPHGFTEPTTLTMSIVCINPSVLTLAVGGEWIATDTTALLIGYSVLNMYWIAPIGIGIGLGIYLVKRRF